MLGRCLDYLVVYRRTDSVRSEMNYFKWLSCFQRSFQQTERHSAQCGTRMPVIFAFETGVWSSSPILATAVATAAPKPMLLG